MSAAGRRRNRSTDRDRSAPGRTRNRLRLPALLGAAAVVLSTTVLSPLGNPAPADAQTRAATVTVSVVSVNPSTPAITSTAAPLIITVSLLNNTDTTLTGVTVSAERGDPIGTQAALNDSLSDTSARSGGKAVSPVKPAPVTLTPGVPVQTTFRTTTSKQNDDRLCLCTAAGVYPIDLTAQAAVDGNTEILGGTRTYVPAFDTAPTNKLGVAWVLPLIDRPHRVTDGGVFVDDDLAASVAPGGRLYRALQVVQRVIADTASQVDGPVPMTLMVDPDLVDELQVMSTGKYTVRAANGAVQPGTGQQAAAAWLAALRAVLVAAPRAIDLQFTPLGDPDVTGLTRHHETWTSGLNPTVTDNIETAINGNVPKHTVAWPPTNAATVDTLDRLVTGGADTVLLDSARVRPSTSGGIPLSVARLRTSGQPVKALLTAPALQNYAQAALTGSTAAVPTLMSELAVRVAQRPTATQYAVLAAPRYLDADPAVAARVVEQTANSEFTHPVDADTVTGSLPAGSSPGSVRRTVATTAGLTESSLADIHVVTGYLRPVNALFGGTSGSAAGRTLLATLPDAVQRSESAAWSELGDSAVGGGSAAGLARTTALTVQLTGYLGQVRILNRSLSSYTLSSSNSPLPVTVVNDSSYTVSVIVSVRAAGDLKGFARRETSVVQVGAHNKTTFPIRTNIQRSGRIPVDAQLRTTDNYDLGSVKLFVHSTVLGTIGVVITVVAGVVLALALLVRFGRRLLRLRRKRRRAATP